MYWYYHLSADMTHHSSPCSWGTGRLQSQFLTKKKKLYVTESRLNLTAIHSQPYLFHHLPVLSLQLPNSNPLILPNFPPLPAMSGTSSPKLTGRCQCGQVTYTITSEPHSLNVCHCHECQRQSGSAFALTLVVPASGLHLPTPSHAHIGRFERRTDSGGIRGGAFCTGCGVRIYHCNPAAPQWISVKAGTLDQKVDFGTATHIWTKRKLQGVVIPTGVEAWEEEPDDGVV